MTFRAIVIEQRTDRGRVLDHSAEVRELDDDWLGERESAGERGAGERGAVTIDVLYSGINYKDGMALAGRPGIAQTSPLIPGIDLVGTIARSADDRWREGDLIVLNGDGIGERVHGGLAERARVRPDALVRVPDGISAERAAAIGTAGFTAMLSVLALERQGVEPDAGDVLVTGAAGGVGSIAVAVLAKRGYRVTASTGRADAEGDYLRSLGAHDILERSELAEKPGGALQRSRWAAAVDCVGSTTLANVLAQTRYGGTVTACGLAQGADLPVTVLPFILRAVTLAGVNSVDAPLELRQRAWQALADDLDLDLLDTMTTTIGLEDAFGAADEVLAGQARGRTVVDVRA